MSNKRTICNVVAGEGVDALDGASSDLVNPTTGTVFASAPLSGLD